jgi:hypothetical protein
MNSYVFVILSLFVVYLGDLSSKVLEGQLEFLNFWDDSAPLWFRSAHGTCWSIWDISNSKHKSTVTAVVLHSSESVWAACGPHVSLASLDVSIGNNSLGVSEIEALSAAYLEWLELVGIEKVLHDFTGHVVHDSSLMWGGLIDDVFVDSMFGHFNN